MTPNVFIQLYHQMILQSCKTTSMLYPLGATSQIFCLMSLNLFIFVFCKNHKLMFLHTLLMINQSISSHNIKIYIGINFTNDLLWNKQYRAITTRAITTRAITTRANLKLGLIHHIFKQTPVTARNQLYISLVCSQLLYCSPL